MTDVELRPDPTPILTLPPDEPEPELTEEQKLIKNNKQKAERCKVIALTKMWLNPFKTNVSKLSNRVKSKLLDAVTQLFYNLDHDEIIHEFNEICLDTIFDENEDVSQYYVGNVIKKELNVSADTE